MPAKRLLTLALALAAAVPLTVGTASGGTQPRFAIGVRVCPAPSTVQARVMTCDAMRRVFVAAGTPGARPYTPLSATLARRATGGVGSTIGPRGGLTPLDLWKAYGLTTAPKHHAGSTQTLAIVDAYNDPNIASDLATFDGYYGLAPCTTADGCLRVVNQTGGATLPANDTTGWSFEESIDVEAAHAICQGCRIVLLEANSAGDADVAIAEDTAVNTFHATEVSNSFGDYQTSANYSAYAHPGVVITASTGDDGYYDWDLSYPFGNAQTNPDRPEYPAALAGVVAVGGTSLYLAKDGSRRLETVWNENGIRDFFGLRALGQGATGGGCSTLTTAPTWQRAVPDWGLTGCGTKRLAGDVAAVADPLTGFDIYDSYENAGWSTAGGTSVSAPIVAAIYALAGGSHGVRRPARTLYEHLGSAYDVTVGGDGYCDGESAVQCGDANQLGYGTIDCDYNGAGVVAVGDLACDAGPGYDGPSGVGAPNGLAMFTP